MSYCGWDKGDVYMYYSSHSDRIICDCCSLHPREVVGFTYKKDALEHLEEHIKAGDKVPADAIERLKKEIKEEDNNGKET